MLQHIWDSRGDMSFQELLLLIFGYAALVFIMLPLHELAHAGVATLLGDDTPRWHGRLSLNPLRHLDPFGTVALILFGIGYAKSVPVNPRNFRNPKLGMALTALAGPLSNLLMAYVSLLAVRVLLWLPLPITEGMGKLILFVLLDVFVVVNLSLAAFNLLPVPPLDGFRIFGAILPARFTYFFDRYHDYVRWAVLLLICTRVLDLPLNFVFTTLGNLLCFLAGLPQLF